MIDRIKPPAVTHQAPPPETPVNPFASVITAEVVTDILNKQVEKAREGDTNSAKLILKIAAAAAGVDSSSRRNRETPVARKPSISLLLSTMRQTGPITVHQLAARLSCDADDLRRVLENSERFTFDSCGKWSAADHVPALGGGN